jgi:tetratricopeptide (TPR) repeat protein
MAHASSSRPPALLVLLAIPLLAMSPRHAAAHGPLDQEIAEATQRIESEPGNAAHYLRRGELHRLHHDWRAALADYAQAAWRDPSLKEVELCRAALELDRGRPDAARPVLDRLIAADPAGVEALRLRAEAWMALGRPRDAVRDYDQVIALAAAPSPDHYLARSRAAAAVGEDGIEEALRGLDRGIERLGPLVSLESRAIDLELERGAHDAALSRLDRIAPQFGRLETLHERRGQILAAAGRDAEARAAFAQALEAIAARPVQRRAPAIQEMEARIRSRLAATDAAATSSRSRRSGEVR